MTTTHNSSQDESMTNEQHNEHSLIGTVFTRTFDESNYHREEIGPCEMRLTPINFAEQDHLSNYKPPEEDVEGFAGDYTYDRAAQFQISEVMQFKCRVIPHDGDTSPQTWFLSLARMMRNGGVREMDVQYTASLIARDGHRVSVYGDKVTARQPIPFPSKTRSSGSTQSIFDISSESYMSWQDWIDTYVMTQDTIRELSRYDP
jgi:hypothetical protein